MTILVDFARLRRLPPAFRKEAARHRWGEDARTRGKFIPAAALHLFTISTHMKTLSRIAGNQNPDTAGAKHRDTGWVLNPPLRIGLRRHAESAISFTMDGCNHLLKISSRFPLTPVDQPDSTPGIQDPEIQQQNSATGYATAATMTEFGQA
jgi:hypothetical protein